MESVLDDCTSGTDFKQIRAQRRAAPGCFGFTGARGSCGRSYHGFWENFNLPVVRGSETQTKRKERSISRIAIAGIINDQVKAMVLIKENRAQVLLTLLLRGKQTLLDLSSVCETVKPRSL